ncbi:MAG: proline--tRNA ligase [Varibaculum cambriense]|uniref:proline--tRNA ligase n=1 Tax=Varibaculum cambriense TaxID=184870 RepID=UPI0028FFD7FB|nr:proline--tRNA ligase [Varibaculum cambriense]MDU1051272.1 proline--tRNA ligase [Varibaculum cambriense]
MAYNMSTYFVRTLREDPVDAEVDSHKLLVRAGYIRRAAPGIYTWTPLGLRTIRRVEQVVREEMDRIGALEVAFPALLPREPYEATNRWEEFGPSLFKLQDRKGADYLLAPTHEEMFTLLVKDFYSSYKDLPVVLYQIKEKYRDEARPRAGLIRGREFIMKDAYSFNIDDEGLEASYQQQRRAYQRIYSRLGLDFVICSAMAGAMGGSRSEEFIFPCAIGEDTFVRSEGGYAANVEAVTTIAPEPQDYSHLPAAIERKTPGAHTIEALVDYSNEHFPREDGRAWTKADTLKAFMVAATYADGKREVLLLGVPGDREIDMRRLEASLGADVEMATPEDMAAYPNIVPGFTGPTCAGPDHPDRKIDEDGNISGSPRCLLDPRVVEGTEWIAGAGKEDTHLYHLVAGRDFRADGFIEAAEVRDGDPAPDGSGALQTARGIEIGHIFALGTKYSEALGLNVLDQNGKSQVVTMGSYGIGVSRVMAAIAEEYHDEVGLKWPTNVAPFQVHVLVTGKGAELFEAAQKLGDQLTAAGIDTLIDDRKKVSAGVKFKDAELLGMPWLAVIGHGLKEGTVEVRCRATGERREIAVGDAFQYVNDQVHQDLAEAYARAEKIVPAAVAAGSEEE